MLPPLALSACSAAPDHHVTTRNQAKTHAPGPTVLTFSQGAQICTDMEAWLKAAYSQDMPRFTPTLDSDEAEAGTSQLGNDLQTLDSDLQAINSDALLPQEPGQPSDVQVLTNDCSQYGVTVALPAP